jgi:hypothetical protein
MPTVASWISPKARKGTQSAIAGRGLLAVEPISAGEVVAVKGGHIVDTRKMLSLPDRLQNSEIQIAEGLHLVALTDEEYERVMLFINHFVRAQRGLLRQRRARRDAGRRRGRGAHHRLRAVRHACDDDGVRLRHAELPGDDHR